MFKTLAWWTWLILFLITTTPVFAAETTAKPNILFIVVDDLNDMLKILDPSVPTHTPNIERLAARGVVFRKAYANSTLCNPSRFSLLTGRFSHQSGVYNNKSDTLHLESQPDNIMTYLHKYGYKTIGVGKIFHGTQNQLSAWDDYYGFPINPRVKEKVSKEWPIAWGTVEMSAYDDRDDKATATVIKILETEFAGPTFLAFGLHSPHLPWHHLPEQVEAFNYDLKDIKVPQQPEYDLEDLPLQGKLFAMQPSPSSPSEHYHEKVIATGEWKRAIQAYLVEISYMDSLIGKVLDALDASPNKNNTIIVFFSDHGYHIGEKNHWNKHALWSKTSHIPLVIALPGSQAKVCNRVVSLADIFPTLVELTGSRKRTREAGFSLVPLLKDPDREWHHPVLTTMDYKNHCVLTERWRYIRYKDGGEELYDERFDPNDFYNLIQMKSLKPIINDLRALLPKENAKPINEDAKLAHE